MATECGPIPLDDDVIAYRDTLIAITKVLLGDDNDDQTQLLRSWSTETSNNLKQDRPPLSHHLNKRNLLVAKPKLLALLRDAVLSHRWHLVAQLLSCLVKEVTGTAMSIFKIGLEVFHQDGKENSARLEKFLSQLTFQPELIVKEIQLEHVFSLIPCQQFNDAAKPSFSASQRLSSSVVGSSPRAADVGLLYDAYTGVALYGCWLTCQQRLKSLQRQCSDEYSQGLSDVLGSEREEMNRFAEKAITAFACLQDKPGVWDIFVAKHVELLEYLDRREDALSVLVANATRNPDNPDAQKQVYEFYRRHSYSLHLQTDALQMFCDLQPSDELVLHLHSLLRPAGQGLALLFNMLDYACWRDELPPWQRFADHLTEIFESKQFTELDACWTSRATWWPVYHFSKEFVEKDPQLFLYKAVVAVFLLGPNEYTKKAISCSDDSDGKLSGAVHLQSDSIRVSST